LRNALTRLLQRISEAESYASDLIGRLEGICSAAATYFHETDFTFLFDGHRKLLRIGYNASSQQADEPCYDLLASEARTAVFLAIAKGDIPREAWFRLGRRLTTHRNHRTLLSWSGTMFEYLMPLLYFRTHENTLIGRSLQGAVQIQQLYGREQSVPWGISEAAYADRDAGAVYQYQAFGVPALSQRLDHPDRLVVAPYASMLAAMVDPVAATANLRHLASLGCLARHGFFESIDYSSRGGRQAELVRCFMAHHQGMTLMAIDNALLGRRMQERFHSEPMVQATEFLLEERMPALVDPADENTEHAAA
jgi:cyclic beta-1,2-glucan synthetase